VPLYSKYFDYWQCLFLIYIQGHGYHSFFGPGFLGELGASPEPVDTASCKKVTVLWDKITNTDATKCICLQA
jgi:hypothetical protein